MFFVVPEAALASSGPAYLGVEAQWTKLIALGHWVQVVHGDLMCVLLSSSFVNLQFLLKVKTIIFNGLFVSELGLEILILFYTTTKKVFSEGVKIE